MADTRPVTRASATHDPVCHKPVDPNRTAQGYVHEGRVYYFCSTGCLRRFIAEPEAFAEGAEGALVDEGTPTTDA